jgi:hypothetical protein
MLPGYTLSAVIQIRVLLPQLHLSVEMPFKPIAFIEFTYMDFMAEDTVLLLWIFSIFLLLDHFPWTVHFELCSYMQQDASTIARQYSETYFSKWIRP